MELAHMKNTNEMKNTLNNINRLDTAEEKSSNLADLVREGK